MPAAADAEQEWSLEKSSQLNDAYRTLKDPIARTEYLLRFQGVNSKNSRRPQRKRRAHGRREEAGGAPDLLEEVFELNMQLEELRMNKKMGEDDRTLEHDVQATKQHLQTKNENLIEELRSAWNDWDALIDRSDHAENVSGKRPHRGAQSHGRCAESALVYPQPAA